MRLAEKCPGTRAQCVFWNACMRCLHAACAVQAFVLAETQRQAELTYCQLMCPLQAQFGADPLSGTDPDDDTAPASGMHQHQALLLAVMRCGEVVYQICIMFASTDRICRPEEDLCMLMRVQMPEAISARPRLGILLPARSHGRRRRRRRRSTGLRRR